MTAPEKELAPGERRYVAKPQGRGWIVYDRQRASQPIHVPGFGQILGTFLTEAEADAEAQRLEDWSKKK